LSFGSWRPWAPTAEPRLSFGTAAELRNRLGTSTRRGTSNRRLVEAGLCGRIRHPGYLGQPLGVVAMLVLTVAAFGWRIRVEEAALRENRPPSLPCRPRPRLSRPFQRLDWHIVRRRSSLTSRAAS
jgi:hypothetical protein